MIQKVEVRASYQKASQVPRIGQRKKMRVNGKPEFLTLNDLHLERRGEWNEERNRFDYVFDAQEEWGEFFIG